MFFIKMLSAFCLNCCHALTVLWQSFILKLASVTLHKKSHHLSIIYHSQWKICIILEKFNVKNSLKRLKQGIFHSKSSTFTFFNRKARYGGLVVCWRLLGGVASERKQELPVSGNRSYRRWSVREVQSSQLLWRRWYVGGIQSGYTGDYLDGAHLCM